MRYAAIAMTLFLAVVSTAIGDPDSTSIQDRPDGSRYTQRLGWVGWTGLGELGTFDTGEILALKATREGSFEYEVSQLTFVPLVFPYAANENGEKKRVVYYNFRGIANGLAWGLTAVLAGSGLSDTQEVLESPWHYPLFLPNCRARIRLSGDLKLVVGTRTDYLLYRTVDSDRGLVFTPHIGISRTRGEFGTDSYSGFSISVGYRRMWNFDRESPSGEIALLVTLWGPAGV